jgi:hypothetical protein
VHSSYVARWIAWTVAFIVSVAPVHAQRLVTQAIDIQPILPWLTAAKPPMLVSGAVLPSTDADRATIHSEAAKFEWVAPSQLAIAPERVVGLLLGQTFLASEAAHLELTSFELGVTSMSVTPTDKMIAAEKQRDRVTPPVLGLLGAAAATILDAKQFTVALRVTLRVNGEPVVYQAVHPIQSTTATKALETVARIAIPSMATCIEALMWRQRGQDVNPDTKATCQRYPFS